MRPPTPKSAKQRAWKSFSAFIRKRDPLCVTCKKPTTEAGHFLHTSDKGSTKTLGGNEIWYDERNVNGQCGHCNRWKSGNQIKYTMYLQEKYGYEIVPELYKLFRTPRKYTIEELLEIEERYNDRTK